ncbi:MAG: hypothetical protein IKV94_03550 [Clostridia bacterium]|nr:hypothetical protein [Clostridia bacterium]
MEGAATLVSSITEGVTTLSTGIFNVVTSAFENTNMLTMIGIAIAFGLVGYGLSLIPKLRG